MLWTVPRIWDGLTCAILAGGPSLRGFEAGVLCGRAVVITINDSWKLAPWADFHYYCDQSWADAQKDLDFDSNRWVKGGDVPGVDPRVKVLRFTGQIGFEADPSALRHGSNSGYQAIHLAAHLGAALILLLGYDMRCQGTRSHWHDAPRSPAAQFGREMARDFVPLFEYLVQPLANRGTEVINCTPGSALKCWPSMPLEEVLSHVKGGAESNQSNRRDTGRVSAPTEEHIPIPTEAGAR